MVSPPTHHDSNWPSAPDAHGLQPGSPLLLDKRPAGFGAPHWDGEHCRGATRPQPGPSPGEGGTTGTHLWVLPTLCTSLLSPARPIGNNTPPQSTLCWVSTRLRGEPGPGMCIWKAKAISLGLGWGWRGPT